MSGRFRLFAQLGIYLGGGNPLVSRSRRAACAVKAEVLTWGGLAPCLKEQTLCLSYFAQISDGQKRKGKDNRYAIPKRSVFNSSCTGTHPGVRGLASKQVGRKDMPCKYLQSFKENR